jgi:hypothetical protein
VIDVECYKMKSTFVIYFVISNWKKIFSNDLIEAIL